MRYVLTVLLYCLLGVSTFAQAAKPRPPLRVEIVPVQAAQPQPGETAVLQVAVATVMDSRELRLRLEMLGGVTLVSGAPLWVGPVTQGAVKSFQIAVRLPPGGGGGVRAYASISPAQSATFSAAAEYRFTPVVGRKPRVQLRQGITRDAQGRPIREYRGN